MPRDASPDSDAIAIPPAPNWYGSSLADWGGTDGELYAYAARNSIILLRPSGGAGSHAAPRHGTSGGTSGGVPHAAAASSAASFTGTLVGHSNRVTALAFAQCGGVEHLLVSGSADRHLRLWDTTARRCVKVGRRARLDSSILYTLRRSVTCVFISVCQARAAAQPRRRSFRLFFPPV